LPTVSPAVGVVNASCSVLEGKTPCGAACCARGEACWHWGSCEAVDDESQSPSTTASGPVRTPSSTGSKTTGTSPAATSTAPASETSAMKSAGGSTQVSLGLVGFLGMVGSYLQS
jgi:hypothetical protein